MAEDIVELFRRKPEYFEYFKRAISAEEEYLEKEGDSEWGWRPSEAGIPAHAIKAFLEHGVLRRVFESRRYRIYRLAIPLEEAKRLVGELESKPLVSYDDIVVYAQVSALHPQGVLKVLEYVDSLLDTGRLKEAIRVYEKVAVRLNRILRLYYKASKSRWRILKDKAIVMKRILDKALEIAMKIDKELRKIEEMTPREAAKKLGYEH